jgi:hypothetical protein
MKQRRTGKSVVCTAPPAFSGVIVVGCGGGSSSSSGGSTEEGEAASSFNLAPFEKLVEGTEEPTFPGLAKSPPAKEGANVVALWCARP